MFSPAFLLSFFFFPFRFKFGQIMNLAYTLRGQETPNDGISVQIQRT